MSSLIVSLVFSFVTYWLISLFASLEEAVRMLAFNNSFKSKFKASFENRYIHTALTVFLVLIIGGSFVAKSLSNESDGVSSDIFPHIGALMGYITAWISHMKVIKKNR
ncbi:hypothetical protein IT774_08355 [Salinimonas marina]|uniref:Uncharacterized protein n=1 Tax=Salinimonas marina TaxID=2785918 RepID=A0A7S9HBY7_9ALTE|nr:hypothetical protein [Salinimonas marina]QPG04297.1 hypothetical protein IT774_08355 [Salinimonas marina]